MAGALPLDDDWGYTGFGVDTPVTPEGNTSSTWGDQLRAVQAGAYGVGAGLVGAAEGYLSDPLAPEQGELPTLHRQWREGLQAGQQSAVEAMTPQGRKNFQASVLPQEGSGNDIFDPDVSGLSKVGSTIGSAAPSIVASILGTVFGGPLLGYGAAGAMEAGSVYNEVRTKLENMSDEELSEKSTLYAGLREMGRTEAQARGYLLDQAARNKAILVGVIGAATSRFGAEGIASRAIAGTGVRTGVIKGSATGALSEGAQEGVQEGISDFAVQSGVAEATNRVETPIDWYDLANSVAEGMIGGAGTGAATGAAFGRAGERPVRPAAAEVDPAVQQAVAPQPTPAAAQVLRRARGEPEPLPEAMPEPVPEASPVVTPEADPTPQAAPSRVAQITDAPVDAAVVAAISPRPAANTDPELGDDPDDDVPTLPTAPILAPQVQQAIGAAPETAVLPSVADTLARVRAAAPLPPELAGAPVAPVGAAAPDAGGALGAAPVVPPAPVVDGAGEPAAPETFDALIERISGLREQGKRPGEIANTLRKEQPALTFTQAMELVEPGSSRTKTGALLSEADLKARVQEDVKAARAERLKLNQPRMTKAKREQQAAGATELLTKRELAKKQKQDAYADVATRFRGALKAVPHPGADADLPTMRAYVKRLMETAQVDSKTPLPRINEATDPAVALAATARSVYAASKATLQEYLSTDLAFRGGKEDTVIETRRAQAAQATPQVDEDRGGEDAGGKIAAGVDLESNIRGSGADELISPGGAKTARQALEARIAAAREAQDARRAEVARIAAEAAEEASRAAVAPQRQVIVEKARRRIVKGPVPATERQAIVLAKVQRIADDTPTPTVRDAMSSGAYEKFMAARQRANKGTVQLKGPGGTAEVDRGRTFDEIAADINPTKLSRAQRTSFLYFRDQLTDLTTGTKFYLAPTDDFEQLRGRPSQYKKGSQVWNKDAYHWGNQIVINRDVITLPDGSISQPRLAQLIVHEASHDALEQAIEDPVTYEQIDMLRADMQDYLRNVTPILSEEYGLNDPHEFIAEIMGNPDFQRMAAEIPIDPETARKMGFDPTPKATVWQTFVSLVRRIFNASPQQITALDVALRHIENLFDTANAANVGTPNAQNINSERARPIPYVTRDMMSRVRTAAGDQKRVIPLGMRSAGVKLAPMHYLAQQFDPLFGDLRPIHRVLEAMNKMRVQADQMADEGRKHAEAFKNLERADSAEMRKAAAVVTEITMANMNPINGSADMAALLKANPHLGDLKSDKKKNYAVRANLQRLQDQFMDLKLETREMILRGAKYFRDTQNARTKQLIGKVLSLAKPNLSVQMYADITNRVAKGTLTEDDREIIGDDNLFKALQDAQELRLIEGMYYPLMRHGTHVVTTRDRVENLHGGKLDGEDIIEFRASSDKDALAMFRAFTNDPKNAHLAIGQQVGKRRYMGDKIVSAADATGHTHDVAYRMRLNRRGTYMFESARQAEAFRRENANEFDKISQVLPRAKARADGTLTSQHVQAITKAINRRTDVNEGARSLLTTLLEEASIMQLAGNRIQQRSLPRRNIKGASEDLPRNIMFYASAASTASARLDHMDTVRNALNDMEKLNKAEEFGKDRAAREQVIAEVRKRATESNVDAQAPPQWLQDSLTLSYLYRLFSPAYSVMNGMQPYMVTLPVLGGRYGNMRAMVELNKANDLIASAPIIWGGIANSATAVKNFNKISLNTRDLVGSVRERLRGDPALAAFNYAVERGKIDDSASFEISQAVAGNQNLPRRVMARLDRIARQLPQSVEVVNRAVTLVASYRLAKDSGLDHDAAVEAAYDMMISTQGDYSPQNSPAIFQHPLGRAALQFKKYAFMMGALMHDMLSRGFGKGTPYAERKVAWRQMANLLTVQMLMAGALGLPGLELLKVGAMVAALLGMGEGYEEWERQARGLFDEAFGKTWGELISSGILSRALGIDLSNRLSLADMLTYGEPSEYDKDGIQAYVAGLVMGAPGGMLMDWVAGIKHAGSGEYAKAAEKMIPVKVVTDFSKAVRGRVDRDLTDKEAMLRVIGFQSGRVAEKSEETGDKVAAAQRREKARKELQRRYLVADDDELPALRKEIKAHNEQDGISLRQKLFPAALDRIRKSKEAERRELHP